MPEEDVVREIANKFQEQGYGMVLACSFVDENERIMTRCFSTVSKEDVVAVLSRVSANISQLDYDNQGIIAGAIVVETETKKLSAMVQEAAITLDFAEPMIVSCVSGGEFASFAVGDAPMLVFMTVKLLVSMNQFGTPTFNPMTFDMNPN